jgi:hypothetical protein
VRWAGHDSAARSLLVWGANAPDLLPMCYLDLFRTGRRQRLFIERIGGPDTIRTCDLRLRRATLYPAELRVQSGPRRPGHSYTVIPPKAQSRRAKAAKTTNGHFTTLPPGPSSHPIGLLFGRHGWRISQRGRMSRQRLGVGPTVWHRQAVGAESRFLRRRIDRTAIALALVQTYDRAVPPADQRKQGIGRTSPDCRHAACGNGRCDTHGGNRGHRVRQAAPGQQCGRQPGDTQSQGLPPATLRIFPPSLQHRRYGTALSGFIFRSTPRHPA